MHLFTIIMVVDESGQSIKSLNSVLKKKQKKLYKKNLREAALNKNKECFDIYGNFLKKMNDESEKLLCEHWKLLPSEYMGKYRKNH